MAPHNPSTNGRAAGAVLADRVDGEPPAIFGLSTTELLIVSLCVAAALPLLLGLGALVGLFKVILPLTGFAFLGGIWLGALVFRHLKRGRPLGYYQVRFAILAQRTLGGHRFILRSGPWDLGRRLPRIRLT